jgi:hypothetical protein
MFGNFAKIGRAAGASTSNDVYLQLYEQQRMITCLLLAYDKIGYLSMSTSYSLAKAQSCQTFNQNLVLLFVFSFRSFVKAKFGAFVRIFI